MNYILETRNLTKTFPMAGGKELVVLDEINLNVVEGEFVSILGQSGTGKSTLLRIMAGLASPSKGEVLYQGLPPKSSHLRIAMVFQNFALFPWLTALENVELGLLSGGMPPDEIRERAIQKIDLVGLDGFKDAYPRELSGGMRQRVGLARALVVEPEVLFMDEPFSSLDILTADHLRSELTELRRKGKLPIKSVVLVTHNIEEAVMMSDRAIILSHNPGRIRADTLIELQYPRNRNAREFQYLVDKLYTILTKRAEEIPFLLTRERYQFMPHVKVEAIVGLIELVYSKGGQIDIYALASDLSMDVDDILPLIEAAVFLAFGKVNAGDFSLTETGSVFSGADILKKKEIFREVALRNIRLIRHIVATLTSLPTHRITRALFINILENYFTTDEANNQLDIAIDWGRYAELFAYDHDTGHLYLDPNQPRNENTSVPPYFY